MDMKLRKGGEDHLKQSDERKREKGEIKDRNGGEEKKK